MKIQPETIEHAMDLVWNILKQGDNRYNDFYAEQILANFLLNQAISLEEKEIPKISKPSEKELEGIRGVQKQEKFIGKLLLKQKGFVNNEIFFELTFLESMPDIFAENKEKIILVECCSCRVSKIINYLEEAEEVWILTQGELPWENNPLFGRMRWFIFKKGYNWAKISLDFEKHKIEELKKIKSPFDTLEEK